MGGGAWDCMEELFRLRHRRHFRSYGEGECHDFDVKRSIHSFIWVIERVFFFIFFYFNWLVSPIKCVIPTRSPLSDGHQAKVVIGPLALLCICPILANKAKMSQQTLNDTLRVNCKPGNGLIKDKKQKQKTMKVEYSPLRSENPPQRHEDRRCAGVAVRPSPPR